MVKPNQSSSCKTKELRVDSSSALRLAIVGFGPKGLFCFESLAVELANLELIPRILIDIYEPHYYPGAGVVYDPTQPSYLLMNYAAKYVDAWSKSERGKPGKLSLIDWLSVFRPEHACAEKFIPRATVGEYLAWCLRQILADLAPPITVRFLRSRVTSVSRQSVWSVKSVAEVSGSISLLSYDSVLLTTGHGHLANLQKVGESQLVYPTNDWLTQARIKPASRVRIRGFALTWIDATLALTEGRGGSFTRGGLDEFKYHASGLEPAIIAPYSRTGIPILAKTDEACWSPLTKLSEVWTSASRFLRQLDTDIISTTAIKNIVLSAATEACSILNSRKGYKHRTMISFENFLRPVPLKHRAARAVGDMRRAVEVAKGRREPDPLWSVGEAWRKLYPPIVEAVSHGRLPAEQWSSFRELAGTMERIAFGPPAVNIEKMLALHKCGLLNLNRLSPEYAIRNNKTWIEVNATIPSTQTAQREGPLAELANEGHLRFSCGAEGVEITPQGQCLSNTGTPTKGLYCIGRPTEGWVLGNDTLSRTLHRHPERWAKAWVQSLLREARRRTSSGNAHFSTSQSDLQHAN